MWAKRVKLGLLYALIGAAGLGAGKVVSQVPGWLKPAYTEGNFASYFPDRQTRVVLYGTASCPFCKKTRDYLREHSIAFVDYDIDQSDKAKADFERLGGGAVPLILIGNRQIQGFKQAVIDDALRASVGPAH